MKSKVIALALFVLTAAAVVFYPLYRSNATTLTNTPVVEPLSHYGAKVEVVFVLDTTGSMSGLIQAAKEKIWSIASSMASAQQAPEIRMGLVAYRDRGDAYVTRVVDLSSDLDSMYATLMDFQAAGGGDGPESVNQALHGAVHQVSWSQDPKVYRVVFLVGDAPPHMDYQDDVKYPQVLDAARAKGIVVNTIQSGNSRYTSREWHQIAQLGGGRYFQVEQAGSAVVIATPFDKKLAELSRQLDDTRMYYGPPEDRKQQHKKIEATEKLHAASSLASRARRATFNASKSGKANLTGKGDLIEDVINGGADLSTIDRDQLPESMQDMSVGEQEAMITETAERRNELQRQIRNLAEQRSSYLITEVDKLGGAEDSLDTKIYRAVREQAGRMGLRYDAEAPAY